jgi:CRP/FNR family transcriptional regulator, cyclic AMP receptor protein
VRVRKPFDVTRYNHIRDFDLDALMRIKALSSFSASELSELATSLEVANFKRHEVICGEASLASQAHILLAGVARITSANSRGQRVTVSLVAPGPIPEFPALPSSQYRFQCEAFDDCRVGAVTWERFHEISPGASPSAVRAFHQNNLRHWYRLLLRGSSFLSLDLHERLAIALLDLCADFGIEDSRGMLLSVSFSHRDLANLVGASRPRVTEQLGRLERERMVIRQGRQLVVRVHQLGNSLNARPQPASAFEMEK